MTALGESFPLWMILVRTPIERTNPKTLFPVHTEGADLFPELASKAVEKITIPVTSRGYLI